MRRRSDKLSKVVTVAASEEQKSGQATGRLQQRLDEQLARLGELNAFRHNYSNRDLDRVSAIHWKDYQSFLSRLDTAVQSQQQVIRDCEQNLAVQRQRWMVKRQKLESLERVLEKSREQEAAYQERLEQKQLDELGKSNGPQFSDE